jgi:molybdopterin/thiamine biosynthesis adenylyltransferase
MGKEVKPEILVEGSYTKATIKKFKKNKKIFNTINIFEDQLAELFEIKNPKLLKDPDFKNKQEQFIEKRLHSNKLGNWIYFPSDGVLLHTVTEQEYFELRTNRNKNLITKSEQKKLYNSCVGILGLSVGSNLATTLAYHGVAKNMKLAEFDTLETTNLNRVRANITDIGKPKIQIALEQIYKINPYANVVEYGDGITKQNLSHFLNKSPNPEIIFEIIDDFTMKIRLRLEARKLGIPVVMMANLGDKILIDIERYDLNKKTALFNGVLGDFPEKVLKNPNEDPNKYAVQIIGLENIPKRAIHSVKQIGKNLVGRPQLSTTVTISGATGAYIARKIILGDKKLSGRMMLDLDKTLD